MLDIAHRGAAEPPGPRDPAQVPLDQGHARAFHGDIGAGSHGDPHLGLRQRRSVVDPVARHGHEPAGFLETLDVRALVLRQHFGDDFVDPELFRHRLGRRAAVSGQHHDPHAFGVQLPDSLGAGRLDGIGDAEASCELAVHRDKQRAGHRIDPVTSTPASCMKARFPTATSAPSTRPRAPLPGTA